MALGTSSAWDWIKISYSVCLLIFSIVIVFALMFNEETKISQDVHPAAAVVIMWGGIIWMSMVEGGQCSMVGLPPVNRELYKDTHKITYAITGLGHKGDNLDRYLMGRQFMVIFINFCISLAGAPLAGADVFGLPSIIIKIFLESGIAMVLTNVIIGQLTSQVNASHCMLDYINNHFMTFTLWVALLIEKTGVMHFSYFIQIMSYYLAGKPVESNEPPRDALTNIWFWGRVIWSLAILCFALAVTLSALFAGNTSMWPGVPEGVAVILFFLLMSVVGMLEGMQIAFFAVSKLQKSERGEHPMALRTCELLFRGEGKNLPGFMCGRQMCVTLCFFIIARVTTLDIEVGVDDNIFGVSDVAQNFFNTGILGAIITTILGSISWQLVASAFPIEFLSNPLVYVLLSWCLFLEATGICAGAWFLAMIQKSVMGFQYDEAYIGTPEERAAKELGDDPDALDKMLHLGTNVVQNAPGGDLSKQYQSLAKQMVNFTNRRSVLLENIKNCREQLKAATTKEEKAVFQNSLDMELRSLEQLNADQKELEDSMHGDAAPEEENA
mmetsp:Transcript_12174/g.18541  ORF Transcript_12174/g.18541 Transcript_12174/m.18541 type:complete len:554 (+) Transcript_12174:105-1766(+)